MDRVASQCRRLARKISGDSVGVCGHRAISVAGRGCSDPGERCGGRETRAERSEAHGRQSGASAFPSVADESRVDTGFGSYLREESAGRDSSDELEVQRLGEVRQLAAGRSDSGTRGGTPGASGVEAKGWRASRGARRRIDRYEWRGRAAGYGGMPAERGAAAESRVEPCGPRTGVPRLSGDRPGDLAESGSGRR